MNPNFSVSDPFHLNQSLGTESSRYCSVLVVRAVLQSVLIISGKYIYTSHKLGVALLEVSVNFTVFFIYIFGSLFSNFKLLVTPTTRKKNMYYRLHADCVVLALAYCL